MKMGKKVREYKSGDFIFAKVKGYPAWPARVQKQNGKKYFVYFYGTGETANLPPNMIFDYSENKDKFLNKSVKRKDFNDGVKQIEHDFANNVPLEQVVGALAEAEPAPVDDSMNETANDTVDDSAVADTTADETMDESANANDGPVDDSDDAGALVIDEGKKGRKSAAKPPATPKAKEPKTPRGRAKKEEVKEAKEEEDEKKEEEIVSRSGRKIKPGKRYIDEQTEENATLPSPAPKKRRGASPSADKDKEPKEKPQDKNIKAYNAVQQSELRELKEPFKSADPEKENILITYLPSGQYCGVKLFQSRPASFKSEASRLQWDKQAASNAITLKRQLEKGQITPQSISAQLVMDLNLTDEQKQTLERDRDLEVKKSRLHFLKTEMKLIELDAKIKTCLSLEKADTELCLKLIDEILELDLAALMLLKHPTCMETVKRMRVYVGNTPSWEMSESEALTFSKQAHRIRNKADALFITMRDLFHVPEGVSFSELFNERVAQFKAATENLHADKLLEMVNEPIEMSQPASLTMKAAVDAANAAAEEEPAETEDADKKKKDAKKDTPVKGKKEKANSTPLKQPLKRQSRKQQQEEKEKEKDEEKPEEADTNKINDADKQEETEEKQENSEENEKQSDAEKQAEKETEEADKEVEKANENSEKNEKAEDSEKEDKEVESKTNDVEDKEAEINDSKKESNSDKSKDNGKSKEKESKDKESKDKESKDKLSEKKEEVKNGKDKAKQVDKRKGDKEKSEEKEKVDADEPRAKRSRESKKTETPPRSSAKRKSRS